MSQIRRETIKFGTMLSRSGTQSTQKDRQALPATALNILSELIRLVFTKNRASSRIEPPDHHLDQSGHRTCFHAVRLRKTCSEPSKCPHAVRLRKRKTLLCQPSRRQAVQSLPPQSLIAGQVWSWSKKRRSQLSMVRSGFQQRRHTMVSSSAVANSDSRLGHASVEIPLHTSAPFEPHRSEAWSEQVTYTSSDLWDAEKSSYVLLVRARSPGSQSSAEQLLCAGH